jgi:type VI protein secretion system component VasK
MLRMLLAPRWLVRHVLLVASLVLCAICFRWQLERALERDSILNWSYAIEWGLFGAFALLTWGWFLRDELRGPDITEFVPAPTYQPVAQPVSDDEDPELAAYNRYLAELNTKNQR